MDEIKKFIADIRKAKEALNHNNIFNIDPVNKEEANERADFTLKVLSDVIDKKYYFDELNSIVETFKTFVKERREKPNYNVLLISIGSAINKMRRSAEDVLVKMIEEDKEKYTHPMSILVQNIDSREGAKVLLHQLNETGIKNLMYFVGLIGESQRRMWNEVYNEYLEAQ